MPKAFLPRACCSSLDTRLESEKASQAVQGVERTRRALAVRPGSEGDPRKRATGSLAGLQARSLQLLAFVLWAALAGLAGGTKAIVFQLASLTDSHWNTSGEVILMTLLGGLGTILGLVAGASIVVALENYLARLGAWGHRRARDHLRRPRAHVPARRDRRAKPAAEETAVARSCNV